MSEPSSEQVRPKHCHKCGSKEDLTLEGWGDFHDESTHFHECRSCTAEKIKKQIAEFDGDTSFTDEVECPHCGHVHQDSWELDDSDDDMQCHNCDNNFSMQRYVDVTYSTTKGKAA